jgi:hypothetical protein
MGNKNRVFYGSQVAQVRPATTGWSYGSWYQPLGVQSVGMNTTFDTQQTFQLGSLDLYNISENVPNVEVTINKLLDGTSPLYLMCMGGRSGIDGANCTVFDDIQTNLKGFGGLSANTVDFRLGIYDGIDTSSTGNTNDYVLCQRMYLSRLNYTFPIDGNGTEEISLVGNNKLWSKNDSLGTMGGYSFDTNTLKASRLARRQFVDLSTSTLPIASGGMPTGVNATHLQSITISANLGRENINELGAFAPRTRYATFPIEVTSEFQVVATEGDYVDAKDFLANSGCSILYKNLNMLPITISVCGALASSGVSASNLQIFLGSGNQLTSVNYTGGDTGGGNATVTYSFRNYNDFYMKATSVYASGATV